MRIINLSTDPVMFTDLDRGLTTKAMAEDWNAKSYSGIPVGGHIDVFDTERVMLSAEMGQIAKFRDASVPKIATAYSITGTEIGPFNFDITNDTFSVTIGTGAPQSFTLSGTAATVDDVVILINATAVGFVAEKSNIYFRTPANQNTGFLVLQSSDKITINAGNANLTLGFNAGDFTKCK